MKRIGNIFEKIVSIENLNLALDKACRKKRDKSYVKRILDNRDYYISTLQKKLLDGTFKFSDNISFEIFDKASNKIRLIHMPKFYPDQIVHWALCLQITDIIKKGMYKYNVGSVPGRGGIAAKRYIDKIYSNDKKIKYVMKLDIKKYFPNVSKCKLKSLFRRKIKDIKTLTLIDGVIDNCDYGLPIGYYTSQWFSNFYLEELDHFIKEKLKIRYYVRNVDDMVFIDTNKRKLRRALLSIKYFLLSKNYNITIKDNWQIWKIHSRPLDFVGYKFYKDKTKLRNKIFYHITRLVRRVKIRGYCNIHSARSLSSLLGWLKHIPCGKGYYLNNIKPVISKNMLSNIISNHDRNIIILRNSSKNNLNII